MNEAERITRAMGGTWHGRFGMLRCPCHNDHTASLSVGNGRNGRVLLHCHAGCSFPMIAMELRGKHLLGNDQQARALTQVQLAQLRAADNAAALKKESLARRCWEEALPAEGSLVEVYLRSRKIACALPTALRFHPECWHLSGKRLPAMVSRVEGAPGFALHRTYLQPDGSGKAPLKETKMMLGRCSGGAVRLINAGGPLVVAEGIETALSLASGLLLDPLTVWAALSAGGIRSLILPPAPDKLIIASDGDNAGHDAAQALAGKAFRLGWTVSLLPAPQGEDWNDILMKKGGA